MICPFCSSSVPDGSTSCPSCGSNIDDATDRPQQEFIFCEGCGARLSSQDRVCPKCARPAPGILSQHSAAADLAAGKTASFPRLTPAMIAEAIPAPAFAPDAGSIDAADDPDSTSVLDADGISAAARDRVSSGRAASRKPLPQGDDGHSKAFSPDDFSRPHRLRWVFASLLALTLAGGAWFVVADPMGVMPGLRASFEQAASEMYPSRQTPEDPGSDGADATGDGGAQAGTEVTDSTLSEAEAFQRLSAIYAQIVAQEDEIGPVIDSFNGKFSISDRSQREDAAQGAYELRDKLKATIDELNALDLADDSAYLEDVDHLVQLSTWSFNRVDVLCRSWDINLSLPEGELPENHQGEILAPLREIKRVDGRAVDVISYEENVAAWMPREK